MNKKNKKRTAHGFSPQFMWLMLCMLFVGTGSAWADEYVAQIGSQKYTDLTEAFYDASAGQTVLLLQDLDISVTTGSDQYCAEIPNSITFDGGGHKLTVNRRGISVAPQSNNSRAMRAPAAVSTYDFHVTIKNITIENTASQSRGYGGRCITTRGKLGSLTLESVTLTTAGSQYNNTLSPLYIGGNQTTAATVKITSSRIIADASAAKGNAITMVNPIALNLSGSTLTAATAINFAEPDESAGANGSTVTIASSTISSTAAAFHFYDNDIAVNVEASTINAGDGTVATFGTTTGNTVRLASAGNVVSYTTLTDAAGGESFSVSKGTFNHVVPNAYLADEFDVTANLADQETLTTPLTLTSGSKMTIASGSIKGDVVAEGGTLVFGTTDTNDITVTGNQSLNLNTGYFVNDIAEQYLAEHFATNLISDVYVVKPTIQIATVADLQELATLVNTPNGAATSGNTYELTVDLDMTGVNWTPIGNLAAYPGRSFQGTFDGKGHTIRNLTCVDNTVNYATAALFGSTKNGIIKNLTLSNVDIQSKHYAAAFVAYTSEGTNTVENCHVVGGSIVSTPELINGSYDNGDKVGGIVGYTTNFNIINCSVENVTLQAYRDLGGLAGYVRGGTVEGNTVKDVTLTQDNTNGYKKNEDGSLQDMSSTVGMVVGGRSGYAVLEQASDATKNTTDNVVITDPVVIAKIGTATFATLEAAVAAATEGQTVEICKAGTYTMPSLPQNITIKGAVSGVVFNCEGSGNIAAVPNGATFENVTMKFGTNDYHGFQHSGEITMKDCTLNGKLFNYNNMVFDGCTFNAPGTEESGYSNKDYSMWVYGGDVTYTNCTFNSAGKVVNVYNDQVYTTPFSVTATNCTFNSTVANKAAFNVKATCGSTALLYEVTVEDCETETPANWPAASESSSLVVLNPFVQVDDINPVVPSVTDITQITTDPVTGEKTEEVLYTTRVAEYNGTRYDTFQEAIDAAEAADEENIVINLLNVATLDITAWDGTKNPLSIGTVNTQTITINGNSHTLNFNKKNSDWNNIATMNDAQTKLILNDMTLTDSGYNNGPWNRYDINFNCNVELNNVTSTKALAFKNDATLNNVTVEDNNDVYGIWIQTKGQSVTMNDVTVNVPNGRGIAIKDQYVDAAPAETTALEAKEVTFTTAKKAAILVTSQYGAEIKASDLDITNVAADSENAVWVDEDRANVYGEVTLTGDANMIPEGGVEAYTVVRTTGDKVNGYYTDLAKAVAEAEDGQNITLYADFDLAAKTLTIEKGITVNGQDHKVSSTAAQAVQIGAGNFNVAINNLNVDATQIGLAAGTASDASSLFTGELAINNSTFTVGTRGINLINVGEPFKLNLDNSTVQLRGIEDYNTAYSNADTRGINLCNYSDGRIAAYITNSTVQGFAYDINLPGKGSNVDVTMTGGKTAGRAALNIWGKNNNLTLDGVEAHGLNNETGPTEQFACLVENEGAENNTYNIKDVTFIANLSEAAYTTETATATEDMMALRGNGSTINITGNTTYTINEGAEERGGLIRNESQLQGNTVNLDATAKENLAALIDALNVATASAEPNEDGMYTLEFTGVVKLYSADMKQSKMFNTLADAFADTEIFEANSQMDLMADVVLAEDITISLAAGQEFAIDLDGHSLKAGEGHILLPTGVIASTTAETDVFAKIEERDDLVPATSVLAPDYYTVSYVAEHHEVSYAADGETKNYLFEEVFADGKPAAGSTITLLKDITLIQSVSANSSFALNFDGNSLNRGEFTITLGSGVTVTTDEQVADYEDLFIPANATEMVVEAQNGGKYTYTIVSKESEGIYELADGVAFPYNLTSDVLADKVTYTRSYDENRVDKYQGWMLPFDYTITAEDLENFSFFKISMVAHSNVAGESASTEDIWIHVNPMSAGEVLRANKPYIYKPKAAIDNYEFVSENVTLKKPMETMLLQTATTEATYSFYGTYVTTSLQPSDNYRDFYLSVDGDLSYPNSNAIAVGPYRWYLRMETKSGIDYARSISFIEEDDMTVTGLERVVAGEEGDTYYTLNGVRVQTPGKGVYIKRSADGTTKKVSFK